MNYVKKLLQNKIKYLSNKNYFIIKIFSFYYL